MRSSATGINAKNPTTRIRAENIASARTIQKNGGVLENEVVVDGVTEQRYWIDLG